MANEGRCKVVINFKGGNFQVGQTKRNQQFDSLWDFEPHGGSSGSSGEML